MDFGKVDNPGEINFTLPPDHPDTIGILRQNRESKEFEVFVGCAKWNKTDLKNFYPKGTKDELAYYSTQFNSIELNATFYNSPTKEQAAVWKQKSTEGFRFFPKLNQSISHFKRLQEVKAQVEEFCEAAGVLEEKLGMVFLQMHNNFKPKDFARVEKFIREFPTHIPLAVEVRNEDWFRDEKCSKDLYELLENYKVTNIIVDTAGRRDMLHMRLTTPAAFIRYVGANHESDYKRLDDWVERIKVWKEQGLQDLYFFVHQNLEMESPLLSAYFIRKLNAALGTQLKVPETISKNSPD